MLKSISSVQHTCRPTHANHTTAYAGCLLSGDHMLINCELFRLSSLLWTSSNRDLVAHLESYWLG